MTRVCIVTGGAGFIGCAISAGLAAKFDRVIAVDMLHPQVHALPQRPAALAAGVELIHADITYPDTWNALLASTTPDTVVHLAAETGTGQSLTESARHTHTNVTGTAVMLDAFVRGGVAPRRIVLSSSRAVYGEGAWRADTDGHITYPGARTPGQLSAAQWDFTGLTAMPSEASVTRPAPVSVYGATKLAQEHVLTAWAGAYGVELAILRLQNVYGPGQSLTNAYTGIVTLFCRLARSGQSIPLYEDGRIIRDFVLINDVADALLAAIDLDVAIPVAVDIGTGRASSIAELAQTIAAHYDAPSPHVCGRFRLGDVRYAACKVQAADVLLGWSARTNIAEGLVQLAEWIESHSELLRDHSIA